MKSINSTKLHSGPIKKNIYTPLIKVDSITNSDYKRGYIWRYFFKQCNNIDSAIYEINESEYNKIKNYFLYKSLKIKWKITGDKEEVKQINTNIIDNSKKILIGIDKLLNRNVLLYWKDDSKNNI